MNNLYLFQPQFAVEVRRETNYWLPYSAGCLWSYVQQFPEIKLNFDLKDIVFRREPLEEVIARMQEPKLCGFCCYLWNEKYCLALAQAIKQQWPGCVIIFGGPQANSQMTKYNFIDTIVMGEGEEIFLDILQGLLKNKQPEIFYSKKRLEQLEIPSPYTLGLFDSMIQQNPLAKWSMVLETNRGCPYECTFCDWGGVTYSKIKKFDIKKVHDDLEWAVDKPVEYLFCADANFGIFKERDVEIASLIRNAADRGNIEAVALQYAKNSTEYVFKIAQIMGDIGRGVTVSVQSMNTDTLEAVKRKNMAVNNMCKIMQLSEQYNVPTYTEVILGLPEETMETWKQGLCDLLSVGQHYNIDVWFSILLANSELSTIDSRRKYGLKTVMAQYSGIFNLEDSNNILEETEIISGTNTMTLDEMIESYMYAWMIIHFHVSGYTQIIARWYNNVLNVSYRDYYDRLFVVLQQSQTLSKHFNYLRDTVKQYLQTGTIPSEFNSSHNLHAVSYEFLYNNRKIIYDVALNVAEEFFPVPSNVITLQQNFIYDVEQQFPICVDADVNFYTGEHNNCSYTLTSKIEPNTVFDFYMHRRKGYLKNHISMVM